MHTRSCSVGLNTAPVHACMSTRGHYLQNGDVCVHGAHTARTRAPGGLRVYTHANMPTRSVARA